MSGSAMALGAPVRTVEAASRPRAAQVVDADEAARQIRSGDTVVIGGVCSEPQAFLAAMVRRANELRDVTIVHQRVLGPMAYVRPGMEGHFFHKAIFVGPEAREAIASGRADFAPVNLSDVDAEVASGALRPDVTVIQTAPPDEAGLCNMGAYVGFLHSALNARVVIAECNDRTPHTFGDTRLPTHRFDFITHASYPLHALSVPAHPGVVEEAIADVVQGFIRDGATLQIGHGTVPDAILKRLKDRNDLGIHSELLTDKMIDLIESGVVTNRKKQTNQGKTVGSFLNGTERMFRFVDRNPNIELYASAYVNSPRVIAENDNVVAVNSAIEIDLLGQINAETMGHRLYSGSGGQMDFALGARMSQGGRFIVVLPATAKGGAVSRIVPALTSGSAITVPRTLADTVVTEFGAAELRGRTMRERAAALIAIAAPQFRDAMRQQARSQGLAV